jgi:hypothetical protein
MIPFQQSAERVLKKARSRGLSVGHPVSEQAIIDFELEYKVSLPREYVAFLRLVGNGNEGPYDASLLYFPDPYRTIQPRTPPVEFDPDRLSTPFPFEKAWLWEDAANTTSFEETEAIFNGTLAVANSACGGNWQLVVTGKQCGLMWLFTGVGIAPVKPFRTFLEWFEAGLDDVPLELAT